MKKPINYYGLAFEAPQKGFNKKYLKTKEGKMEIEKLKKQQKKLQKQLKKRGFDNSELWNLEFTIAKFVYPRLKEFRKINNGYPSNLSEKKWNEILDKMILAFKNISKDKVQETYDLKKLKKIHKETQKGLELFGKYFMHLWC